jgi:hypothetical protein
MAMQYAFYTHTQLRGNLAVEIILVVRNHDDGRAFRQRVQRAVEDRCDVAYILSFRAFGCAIRRRTNLTRAQVS